MGLVCSWQAALSAPKAIRPASSALQAQQKPRQEWVWTCTGRNSCPQVLNCSVPEHLHKSLRYGCRDSCFQHVGSRGAPPYAVQRAAGQQARMRGAANDACLPPMPTISMMSLKMKLILISMSCL